MLNSRGSAVSIVLHMMCAAEFSVVGIISNDVSSIYTLLGMECVVVHLVVSQFYACCYMLCPLCLVRCVVTAMVIMECASLCCF